MVCHSWDMWSQHAERVVAYGDKLRLDPVQGSWVDQRAPRPGASCPDGPASVQDLSEEGGVLRRLKQWVNFLND